MTPVLQLSKQLAEMPQVLDNKRFAIRQFVSGDVQLWLELRDQSFAREQLGVRKWTQFDFATEFTHRWWWDPSKMWVAEANSEQSSARLLGSVALAMRGQPSNVKPVVHWLMVSPEVRRQGLARSLMSHLELAAYEAGNREIWLETHSAWRAAARFYHALGYCSSD
ncbi:MAG: GNAT family N-acetyltransferase [Pirellulales bacterium]|nr:GNAT family N-acetyltransferase [Pirellulales bacterium]